MCMVGEKHGSAGVEPRPCHTQPSVQTTKLMVIVVYVIVPNNI